VDFDDLSKTKLIAGDDAALAQRAAFLSQIFHLIKWGSLIITI
jgi:hypothetical protein